MKINVEKLDLQEIIKKIGDSKNTVQWISLEDDYQDERIRKIRDYLEKEFEHEMELSQLYEIDSRLTDLGLEIENGGYSCYVVSIDNTAYIY